MKKLTQLFIIIVSMCFFFILFFEKNKEDVATLSSVSYGYVDKISSKEGIEVSTHLTNRMKHQQFLDELLKLADDHNYIVVTNQVLQTDANKRKTIFYIYDKDQLISKSLYDTYGNGKKKNDILSTETCLSLINSSFLDKEVYEYKDFSQFMDEFYTVNDFVSYNVFSNNKTKTEAQIRQIAYGKINVEIEDSWGYQKSGIHPASLLFMMISIICLMISIIYLFLNDKKEINIAQLVGYNNFELLYHYLFIFLIKIILSYVLCQITLVLLCVDFSTHNSWIFIKNLIFKDLIFLFILSLFCICSFLLIIRKTNLKKDVNYLALLNFTYCIKIICIFIFCYLFTVSFEQNQIIINQSLGMMKYRDLCNQYYSIANMVDSQEANEVLNLFLKEKKTIACFQYSEDDDTIPFLVANKNYVKLFSHEKIKNNTLLVPNEFEDISLSKYMLDRKVHVQYTDEQTFYSGLTIYPGQTFKNPIIYIIDHDYYSPMHLLLSKDKSIEEYQQIALPYIDTYELRLENANRTLEQMLIYLILPALVEMTFYFILFVFSFVMIIHIFMKIYFQQYKKDIAVKYTLGYRFIELYYPVYLLHIFAYIPPIFLVCIMIQNIDILLIFFIITFSFDCILQTILLIKNHHKSKLMLLKDGE